MSQIICGPILRKLDANQLVLWWVSDTESEGHFYCYHNNLVLIKQSLCKGPVSRFKIGNKAIVHLLDLSHQLPLDVEIEYDLVINDTQTQSPVTLQQQMPSICYTDRQRCSFIIESQLNNLLHGSCRNPHHPSEDSLLAGDKKIADTLADTQNRPTVLILSGDQIYADHVAGPMLYAIHQVIDYLGLNEENLPASDLESAANILGDKPNYYERQAMLPLTETTQYWRGKKHAQIFTGAYVHNHLVSLSEVFAMYLLVWSPVLWQTIDLEKMPKNLQFEKLQREELDSISKFRQGLPQVQRLLAHVATYMIFDDHDVTDDWNLTAQWELTAYENPLARRIIGNALFAYWLFQGWGNSPQNFNPQFLALANDYQQEPKPLQQDLFIDCLLAFNHWHYELDTSPKVIVLDCRTQRWRSESNLNNPSGLMDWESLCQLQQQLLGETGVILVSPAPIFGVKLIESIQRLATLLGQSLAVDAENWMAHPGSANTLLNIFRHPQTPQNFVILSGDVHYSFVYEVELRFRNSSPKIWQITSSGIKNQFPSLLIRGLDWLNRYFYAVYSPLNFFTKRRDMKVNYRPVDNAGNRLLIEKSGLGYLELNADASPKIICDLHNDGSTTEFISKSHN